VEGEVKDNPVLALFKYHITPRYPEIVIKRPEKFGGGNLCNIAGTRHSKLILLGKGFASYGFEDGGG